MKVIIIVLALVLALTMSALLTWKSDVRCKRIENAITSAKTEIITEIRNATDQASAERAMIFSAAKTNEEKLDAILSIANTANQDFKQH